jgi:murein DD-endopeptidase MepM/ murein hydrolase activator NlpD
MTTPTLDAKPRCLSAGDRRLITAVIVVASVLPVEVVPHTQPHPSGSDGQYSSKQGQVLVVKIAGEEGATQVEGRFLGRKVPFFPEFRRGEAPGYVALLGLDLQEEPGTHELKVEVRHGERTSQLSYNVLVIKEKFKVEHLKLPKDQVDLSEKDAARWKEEQEQVKKALAEESAMRLWQASFVEPVQGRKTGIFGSTRILNGQARSPHNGEDIGAPLGTDVVASNSGVVRLTVDHLFSGRGIFVDHGLGLYSMYFHLSDILVKDGDLVKTGQVIGKVGATGRATGPHLHWGVKVNGARVNPYALLDLPLPKNGAFQNSEFSSTVVPVKE